MTRARTWEDLLLVAFAVGLAGLGLHGLLQPDTAPRAERPDLAVAADRTSLVASETGLPAARSGTRFEPRPVEASTRYLPPLDFGPEFRDPAGLDPDYALFLEALEASEDVADEEAEFYAEPAFEPELSDAALEAFDDEELARELENYDTFLAELAEGQAANLSERRR